MKVKHIAISIASIAGLALLLWCFFSVRSCVQERQWLALGHN